MDMGLNTKNSDLKTSLTENFTVSLSVKTWQNIKTTSVQSLTLCLIVFMLFLGIDMGLKYRLENFT